MIHYDPTNRVTLIGTRADGTTFSASPMDEGYDKMETTLAAQIAAATANTTAKSLYLGALHNAQVNIDAGHGDTVTDPEVPKMAVVSDEGIATSVPFDPPLPVVVRTKFGSGNPAGTVFETGAHVQPTDAQTQATAENKMLMSVLLKLMAGMVRIEDALKGKGIL